MNAVFVSGGQHASYRPVLAHFAVLVPHGDSVPGALTAGDLCDLAGALAPRPLHLEAMVDAMNRPVSGNALREEYAPTVRGYSVRPQAFTIGDSRSSAARAGFSII